MLKCFAAVLLAVELFATTFIQIPIGIMKREEMRSSYRDTVFSDIIGDSSNKDLSILWNYLPSGSRGTVAEIEDTSSVVYENTILIANQAQLLAIGSGQAVTDTDMDEDGFGTGDPVAYADGTPAVYSDSASYYLVNDIMIPRGGGIQSNV